MTRMQVYKSRSVWGKDNLPQEWRWRLLAGNSRLIACSGEAFYSKGGAVRAAKRMLKWAGLRPAWRTGVRPSTQLTVDGKVPRGGGGWA